MAFNIGAGAGSHSGGIGQQLTQPQAPVGQADPSQISRWQQFRQKLANDPNLRMALLQTGANLMRSPKLGESGFDVFADAATTGMGTLDQLRQRDKTEGLDERDRTFRENSTTRQIEQGDERIGLAETGVEQRAEGLQLQRGQLAESVRQFEARLDENGRQFDERLAGGGFYGMGGGAGSTGPERMAGIAEKAFIESGIYPDTPQGNALAALRARGLIGKDLTTAQDRMEFAADLAADLILFDKTLTEEQAVEKASSLAEALSQRANASDPANSPPINDVNIGRPVSHPTNPAMSGTLGPGPTPGTYVIIDANGVAGKPITQELAMQLLALSGSTETP